MANTSTPRVYKRDDAAVEIMSSASLLVTGSALVSLQSGPTVPHRAPRKAEAVALEAANEGQRSYALSVTAYACALRACS